MRTRARLGKIELGCTFVMEGEVGGLSAALRGITAARADAWHHAGFARLDASVLSSVVVWIRRRREVKLLLRRPE